MKIVGIILLSLLALIVLVLALVLLVPIGVMAGYREKVFLLKIKFLFLHFTVFPRKEKPEKNKKKQKKKKKTEKKPKEEKKKDAEKKDGKKSKKKKKKKLQLGVIKDLLVKHLPRILGCFYISSIHIRWNVHAADAGDTAIRYGAITSIVGGTLAIFDRFAKRLRKAEVDIFPDYNGEGSFDGDVTVSITLGRLVFAGIRLLIDLIKYKII